MAGKSRKIALAASAGGHLSQLLKLSSAFNGDDMFFVTTLESARTKLSSMGRCYIVGESNREKPLKLLGVLFRCMKIIARERPDVIISTGAAPGCLLCLLGKLAGSKVVWVDSIANVQRLSLSGRIIRPFADLLITQWPDIAGKDRKVEYYGALV